MEGRLVASGDWQRLWLSSICTSTSDNRFGHTWLFEQERDVWEINGAVELQFQHLSFIMYDC